MPREKPWLKMWEEWLDDPKMDTLSLAEQGAWWRLVTLCHRCAADGALVKGNGAPLTIKDMLKSLKISEAPEIEVFSQMVEKMLQQESLHWDTTALGDSTLIVTHYEERQSKSPSDSAAAVRERVRRFREKAKEAVTGSAVTEGKGRTTPPPTPPTPPPHPSPEEEEEEEEDREGSVTVTPKTSLHIAPVTKEPVSFSSKQGDGAVSVTGSAVTPSSKEEGRGQAPLTLAPITPASFYLFEKTGRKRWANLVQKEQFEKAEAEVGAERLKQAIEWALTKGTSNIQSIITAARGGRHGRPQQGVRAPGRHPAGEGARVVVSHEGGEEG